MSFFLDLFKAFGFGLMLFIGIGIVSSLLPWVYGKHIARPYRSIAMELLGRGVFLQRSHGSYSLKRSSYDANMGAEKVNLGGEAKHFFDPDDLMSTFRNKPFGLAHEDRAVIFDARTAFLGRRFAELKNTGDWLTDGHRKAYFAIEEGVAELVNLADALPIIQNPGKPGVVDRVDNYAEKGQTLFDSRNVMQQIQLFIALGVGFGLMWLAAQLVASGASDVGVSLPVWLSWGWA